MAAYQGRQTRRAHEARPSPKGAAIPFLLVLVLLPALEIAIFIAVGERIGLSWTLAATLATALIGWILVRAQGLAVWRRAEASLAKGEMPVAEVVEGLFLLIAGLMLLTPGFFTDALGAALLFPIARKLLGSVLLARLILVLDSRAGGRADPPKAEEGRVIETDYVAIEREEGERAAEEDDPRAAKRGP